MSIEPGTHGHYCLDAPIIVCSFSLFINLPGEACGSWSRGSGIAPGRCGRHITMQIPAFVVEKAPTPRPKTSHSRNYGFTPLFLP